MTDEELESMEIDWTQGVAENFERVKSAARAAIEAANRRADEAEARMYSSQRIAIAAEAEIDTLSARVAELEAGGCARDQGTTQYCAESMALQKRVDEAEEALEKLQQWTEAYPLDIFSEPDFADAAMALSRAGITLDEISASNMRHVLTRVKEIVDAVLNPQQGTRQ